MGGGQLVMNSWMLTSAKSGCGSCRYRVQGDLVTGPSAGVSSHWRDSCYMSSSRYHDSIHGSSWRQRQQHPPPHIHSSSTPPLTRSVTKPYPKISYHQWCQLWLPWQRHASTLLQQWWLLPKWQSSCSS